MTSSPAAFGRYNPAMDLAVGRKSAPADPLGPADAQPDTPGPDRLTDRHQGEVGTSSGVNISPGSDDDGWIVPPPVHLSDGTKVQLYKDGEALHAAYRAIKGAKRRVCLESY